MEGGLRTRGRSNLGTVLGLLGLGFKVQGLGLKV